MTLKSEAKKRHKAAVQIDKSLARGRPIMIVTDPNGVEHEITKPHRYRIIFDRIGTTPVDTPFTLDVPIADDIDPAQFIAQKIATMARARGVSDPSMQVAVDLAQMSGAIVIRGSLVRGRFMLDIAE